MVRVKAWVSNVAIECGCSFADLSSADAALVWSEFIGVIRGCEATLKTKKGYLDRTAYLALSMRTQSTFAHQRARIYDLFEAYLKWKRVVGMDDCADRQGKPVSAYAP